MLQYKKVIVSLLQAELLIDWENRSGVMRVWTFIICTVASVLFFSCSQPSSNGVSSEELTLALDSLSMELSTKDSLILSMQNEIQQNVWDSIHEQKSLDSLYGSLFQDEFTNSWFDSSRTALKDSLLQNSYDSLYDVLYGAVYDDIYSKSLNRSMFSYVYAAKEDLYTAYSNQYALMYKDWDYFMPLTVVITNEDLAYHRYQVKAWIPGWSDTVSVTDFVNPEEENQFGPNIIIPYEKIKTITNPQLVNYRVQTYVLENNRSILLMDDSKPVTLHPPQVFGCELLGLDSLERWQAVWVTPNMDSISSLHAQMLNYMDAFGGYQLFGEATIQEGIRKQVQTVYQVLGSKGISYVSNTNGGTCGQKIKYPLDVLQTRQANCIEGVTLFASILESLGIRTVIVTVSGHAFLGWYTTESGNELEYLETTYTWNDPLPAFSAALIEGKRAYEEAVQINDIKGFVNIDSTRAAGIKPGGQ
jgi:hypothetical protein